MIPQKNRFHGHGSLRYVYKNGTAVRSHLFTLKYVTNPKRKHSRFAVVVSKKVHKSAVGRNRIRRRVYTFIQERVQASLEDVYDIAVIVSSSEVRTMTHDELQSQLAQVFDQISSHTDSV